MSSPTKITCPECGKLPHGHSRCAQRSALITHMIDVHGWTGDQAREHLRRIGFDVPVIIDDKMIADWNAMVAAGVIE